MREFCAKLREVLLLASPPRLLLHSKGAAPLVVFDDRQTMGHYYTLHRDARDSLMHLDLLFEASEAGGGAAAGAGAAAAAAGAATEGASAAADALADGQKPGVFARPLIVEPLAAVKGGAGGKSRGKAARRGADDSEHAAAARGRRGARGSSLEGERE